ncbi:hypothetical protein F2P81_002661 [Scophthalmus maximus]|uniref:Uncharacterized protein n=1 Tax=Scophthalmus maximus TaxID=52904 RepID=A0A6A4TVQ6_SCOMX|nr:hypothetical protein F2P81_002661 [Scophthalmus maximus]
MCRTPHPSGIEETESCLSQSTRHRLIVLFSWCLWKPFDPEWRDSRGNRYSTRGSTPLAIFRKNPRFSLRLSRASEASSNKRREPNMLCVRNEHGRVPEERQRQLRTDEKDSTSMEGRSLMEYVASVMEYEAEQWSVIASLRGTATWSFPSSP